MSDHAPNSKPFDVKASDIAKPFDIEALRRRLQSSSGPKYWRSLDELAETPEFVDFLRHEFPAGADVWDEDPAGRRHFLKIMGASLAMAGLTACTRQPEERILPAARAPEEVIPGKPLFFASAVTLEGYADGVLVESHQGRPTKIEGNPSHPSSLGATSGFGQAAVLSLYDPDRSKVALQLGRISSWSSFAGELARQMEAQKLTSGAGIRILTETVVSPTLAAQLAQLTEVFPEARWHQYESVNRDEVREGARRAFGEYVETHYRLDQAQVILSLGSDLLSHEPGSLRYAREFARARRVEDNGMKMNRLYAVESVPTPTGSGADHRLRLEPRLMESFARAVAAELGVAVQGSSADALPEAARAWIAPLAADLRRSAGASVVTAGREQPAAVHALAHAINATLGNLGKTVIVTEPIEARPESQLASLQALIADLDAKKVQVLIILGGNPVYTVPADLDFAAKISDVPFRVHLGLELDETAELCHWHLPEAHWLEAWSDARAYDGTVSIVQPLIEPLYAGKSAHEVMAALLGEPDRGSYDIVREHWSGRLGGDFQKTWRRALHDGVIANSAAAAKTVTLAGGFDEPGETRAEGLEILFRPDGTLWDGRFANNGWLQELPRPMMLITWDNVAQVSPATAEKLGLANEQVVELRLDGRSVEAPVWISPGHCDNAVTVTLGYGRTHVGRVGRGVGFDANRLRTSAAFWSGAGLEVSKTSRQYSLANVQDHYRMEGRDLIRRTDLEAFTQDPEHAMAHGVAHETPDISLYPQFPYNGYAWGMAIDLNACTGCNGCMVACQSENNIPVVGKQQVENGREMHWLRIDRYYEGTLEDPETCHQPVMCQQCENAPCEPVCPVGATVHSEEGLNDMVYNRCVGTRYCSNNCPYKVRRFNFFLFQDWETPSLKMLRNPDVSVRSRGVMEKCTYCVQRINAARIDSEKQDRKIRDGEITTACQQACPSEALVFGNINDPNSRVSKLRSSTRHYRLLEELNTRPRTTYLGKLRNLNPEMPHAAALPEAVHG